MGITGPCPGSLSLRTQPWSCMNKSRTAGRVTPVGHGWEVGEVHSQVLGRVASSVAGVAEA